jgi:hypothetical protein
MGRGGADDATLSVETIVGVATDCGGVASDWV